MDKQTILTRGIPTKVIKYLDSVDDFSMEDYMLLVRNRLNNANLYIYLIKFKFRLLPDLNVLMKSNNCWYKYIIQMIEMDINTIYNILVENMLDGKIHIPDDKLAKLLGNIKGSISDNELLNLLIEQNYPLSIKSIFHNKLYKLQLSEELVNKLINLNINIGEYELSYDSLNLLIKSINFVTRSFSSYDGFIQDHHIKLNSHLFKSKEDYKTLFSKLERNTNRLTSKCIPKTKKLIYPELISNLVFFDDEKLFKYYDIFPELYKNCKILFPDNIQLKPIDFTSAQGKKDAEYNLNYIINFLTTQQYHFRLDFLAKYNVCFRALFYKSFYNGINMNNFKIKLSQINPSTNGLRNIKEGILLDLALLK
jgi:hypothetical protein